MPSPPSQKSLIKASTLKSNLTSSASVSSDDPYQCQWCTFSTVYKGNMKRHLISCHGTCDELLRKLSFDVERLRRNCLNRPAINELPIIPKEMKRSASTTSDGSKEKIKKDGKKSSDSLSSVNIGGATRGRPRKNAIKQNNNGKTIVYLILFLKKTLNLKKLKNFLKFFFI